MLPRITLLLNVVWALFIVFALGYLGIGQLSHKVEVTRMAIFLGMPMLYLFVSICAFFLYRWAIAVSILVAATTLVYWSWFVAAIAHYIFIEEGDPAPGMLFAMSAIVLFILPALVLCVRYLLSIKKLARIFFPSRPAQTGNAISAAPNGAQ